ncbi:MAG: glycogen/starch synthase [Patescibacteria group bacterium]
MTNPLKILFVAAELNPIAKVGGLADVTGALPIALKKLGVDVRIVIPKYGIVDEKKYPFTKVADNVEVPFNHAVEKISIYSTPLPGTNIPVYLLDHPEYLGGGGIYIEPDASSNGSIKEAHRFLFLSRACLAICDPLDWYPDVIHSHDWHVGMVPVLVKILGRKNKRLASAKTILTIHNLEYQGWYPTEVIMDALGLAGGEYPTLAERRNAHMSTLQQAILACDLMTTVSPSYAKEILTPEYGSTLDPLLAPRRDKLIGVLNGIDVARFNPATDKDIIANFSADDPTNKLPCKADLQKVCGLSVNPKIPILGVVTRFAEQKGMDLICSLSEELAAFDIQLIMLGTGLPPIEAAVKKMVAAHPDIFYAKIAFDAPLAQKIYAGSDLFLMPSKFEPCGLAQMISMRYGTVPVVRATGGLIDTVKDFNPESKEGDGFVFNAFDAKELSAAIKRGLALYQDSETWYKIVRRIMQNDFSWNNSAEKYLKLYQQLAP